MKLNKRLNGAGLLLLIGLVCEVIASAVAFYGNGRPGGWMAFGFCFAFAAELVVDHDHS